jgi:hypothetical protein
MPIPSTRAAAAAADEAALRPALAFQFFNTVNWQIALGAPMVLFVQRLGASPFQAGLAYSFVYLLTPVQVLATVLLPAWGYKRVALGGWGVRSVALVVPLVVVGLRPTGESSAGVAAIVASVGFFCLCRSVGMAALTSWLYALIPERLRVRYFTREQFLAGLSSSATQLLGAALFAWLAFPTAIAVLYVIALAGSGLSYFALKRLPDAPYAGALDLGTVLRESPRRLVAPGAFRNFLWLAAGWLALVTPIPPFVTYYLRAVAGESSAFVMQLEFVRFLSMSVGAWLIGRTVGRWGSRAYFRFALGGLALVAAYWLVHLGGHGGRGGLYAVSFVLGVAQVGWVVASADHLPRVVAGGGRPALLVALFGAVTSFAGGLAPVLWGPALRTAQAPGFSSGAFAWFFAVVLAGAAGLGLALRRGLGAAEPSPSPVPRAA